MFSRLAIPLLQSNKYLLNASEVLGIIVYTRKIVENKLKQIWPYIAYSLIGQKTNEQVITQLKNVRKQKVLKMLAKMFVD